MDTKKVGVRNSYVDTILFIRSAERDHTGKYTLTVQIENMEDKASIDIRIVGKCATNKTEYAIVLCMIDIILMFMSYCKASFKYIVET